VPNKTKTLLSDQSRETFNTMWVIFHDGSSRFTHIDKNVFALVEDKDILEFQVMLSCATGEMTHVLIENSMFLQNFVGNDYFARKYVPMTPHTDTIVRQGPPALEIPKASLFRDVELPSPCSNGQ